MAEPLQRRGSEFLANTTTSWDQSRPSIGGLPDGRFIVAWADSNKLTGPAGNGGSYNIYGQIFDAYGRKIGAEFVVNTVVVYDQIDPEVAVLPSGKFVITWTNHGAEGATFNGTGEQLGVSGQLFDSDGAKLGGEFLVNTKTSGSQARFLQTAATRGAAAIRRSRPWPAADSW
jgi:hypothetical protein